MWPGQRATDDKGNVKVMEKMARLGPSANEIMVTAEDSRRQCRLRVLTPAACGREEAESLNLLQTIPYMIGFE